MAHSKLFIANLLALALALAFAGCGKKDEGKKAEKSTETATEPGQKKAGESDETPPAGGGEVIRVEAEFATPESVLYDVDNDVYLVSNINGAPVAEDDNGFISKVSPEGKVVQLKWIDGAAENVKLDAPKGMAIVDGVLYVADITAVRMFDAVTGEPKGETPIEGATFVNDLFGPVTVTDKDGKETAAVYATDSGMDKEFKPSGTDAVYRIADGKAEPVLKDAELGGPNGVVADAKSIWVVTFRKKELFAITDGKKGDAVELPTGGLDGIVMLPDGNLLISSWEGSAVYRGPAAGPFEAVIEQVESPADIGYDSKRKRVLIPLFQKNVVEIHPLD